MLDDSSGCFRNESNSLHSPPHMQLAKLQPISSHKEFVRPVDRSWIKIASLTCFHSEKLCVCSRSTEIYGAPTGGAYHLENNSKIKKLWARRIKRSLLGWAWWYVVVWTLDEVRFYLQGSKEVEMAVGTIHEKVNGVKRSLSTLVGKMQGSEPLTWSVWTCSYSDRLVYWSWNGVVLSEAIILSRAYSFYRRCTHSVLNVLILS